MNKSLKKGWNIITWTITVLVALLAILLSGVRLIGYTPYSVLSGSMEPEYPVGSLIYVRRAEAGEIAVGDPITYILNEKMMVSTHRVIKIDEENMCFHTKGDANDAPDGAPVHFKNLIGKPVFCIPEFGYFSAWIIAEPGRYIGVCFGIVLLMLFLLPDLLEKADSAERRGKSHAHLRNANEKQIVVEPKA